MSELTTFLEGIADAIRKQEGTTDVILASEFANRIKEEGRFTVSCQIKQNYGAGKTISWAADFVPRGVCGYTKFESGKVRHFFMLHEICDCAQGADDSQVGKKLTISGKTVSFMPNGTAGTVFYWIIGTKDTAVEVL